MSLSNNNNNNNNKNIQRSRTRSVASPLHHLTASWIPLIISIILSSNPTLCWSILSFKTGVRNVRNWFHPPDVVMDNIPKKTTFAGIPDTSQPNVVYDDTIVTSKHHSFTISRREIWKHVTSTAVVCGSILTTTMSTTPRIGNAACLYGDTSPDCIGVYKVPMDDEFLPYMDTPEELKSFAPDVRWVKPIEYPKSYSEAFQLLTQLRHECNQLNDIVLQGDLEQAGVQLLGIIPRVTVSGRVILRKLEDLADAEQQEQQPNQPSSSSSSSSVIDQESVVMVMIDKKAKQKKNSQRTLPTRPELLSNHFYSMRSYRAGSAHTELLAKLGECDVLIGQARSGQLGAITLAQIHILADVRDALQHFDEMIGAIPDSV